MEHALFLLLGVKGHAVVVLLKMCAHFTQIIGLYFSAQCLILPTYVCLFVCQVAGFCS